MARAATTTDAFNAIAEASRRDILVALAGGEAAVGEIVERLRLPQPQVSKHLGVLRTVDLVRCRTVGRHRLYRVNGAALKPVHDWIQASRPSGTTGSTGSTTCSPSSNRRTTP